VLADPGCWYAQVLQHEIRKTHARNQKVEWVDDLVLMETIGKGGFGVVYKGSWKGSLAAIKVRTWWGSDSMAFWQLGIVSINTC
jgi:hypothetical protein